MAQLALPVAIIEADIAGDDRPEIEAPLGQMRREGSIPTAAEACAADLPAASAGLTIPPVGWRRGCTRARGNPRTGGVAVRYGYPWGA